MPYNRPYPGGFVDFPSTSTPIDASALNTMDVGIKTSNDQFQTVTTAQRATLTPSVGQAVWDSDLKQLMVFMNASGGNAWQPVGNRIVCASTTRPSSPFEGQEIYETDTQKTLVYSGSAWVETNDLDYSPSATVCTSSTRPTTGLFEGQRIYETDTNMEFTYSGSGWVQTNQWSTTSGVTGINNLIVPPMVKVYRSSDLTSYTQSSSITWNAEEYDTDGMWTSGTDITIKTAGIWLITGYAFVTATATMTQTFFGVKKSGTYLGQQYHPAYGSTSSLVGYSGVHKLAVNDVITADIAITGGSAYNINGAASDGGEQSRLSLVWLGKDS